MTCAISETVAKEPQTYVFYGRSVKSVPVVHKARISNGTYLPPALKWYFDNVATNVFVAEETTTHEYRNGDWLSFDGERAYINNITRDPYTSVWVVETTLVVEKTVDEERKKEAEADFARLMDEWKNDHAYMELRRERSIRKRIANFFKRIGGIRR